MHHAVAPPSPSGDAVLLYYALRQLSATEADALAVFAGACSVGLRGRIRVALDGINSTLVGPAALLDAHTSAVATHPLLRGVAIDFKLAPYPSSSSSSTSAYGAPEALRVRRCPELVTLGCAAPLRLAAPHASPAAFHSLLSRGGCVLVDVRNAYETAVGGWRPPPPAAAGGGAAAAVVLEPRTRCFSEWGRWLASAAPLLAGRTVLMACTGGVRCERASASLRALGPPFQDVVQLSGGIVRYLEAFPAGVGFFAGSNFVFDGRGTDAPPGRAVVGRCARCGGPHDAYAAGARCPACRMRVLICPPCAAGAPVPRCGLCVERTTPPPSRPSPPAPGGALPPPPPPPLRLLCLHGYRQTGRGLRGRLRALSRRLAPFGIELVFCDGPVTLPGPAARRAWLTEGQGGGGGGAEGGGDGGDGGGGGGSSGGGSAPPPAFRAQGAGLAAALDAVSAALQGAPAPVHGLLGFSQGAAVAFRFAASGRPRHGLQLLWLACGYVPPCGGGAGGGGGGDAGGGGNGGDGDAGAAAAPVGLPSLHTFAADDGALGGAGAGEAAGAALAARFVSPVVLRHERGHSLPSTRGAAALYAGVLRRLAAGQAEAARCWAAAAAGGGGAGACLG